MAVKGLWKICNIIKESTKIRIFINGLWKRGGVNHFYQRIWGGDFILVRRSQKMFCGKMPFFSDWACSMSEKRRQVSFIKFHTIKLLYSSLTKFILLPKCCYFCDYLTKFAILSFVEIRFFFNIFLNIALFLQSFAECRVFSALL